MPRALEERIHNTWISQLKEGKKFRNRKVKTIFKKLDIYRMLSYALIDDSYKKQITETYAGKRRLVFQNKFEYISETKGEYLLLTRDLLSIFAKQRLPIFVKNFPIFVQLKSVPVFWINSGIITLWNFYFPERKIKTTFEEVIRFSDKIAVFPKLEFASFNFIQTYSSVPERTLSFSSLQQKSPKLLERLEKYLTRNFWIIPDTNIKDVSPFGFIFFEEGNLLPCIPYRIIFRILEIRRVKTICLLNRRIKCLEILISYFNASGDIQIDVIYFPTGLFNIKLEKEKLYNGLFFTFVDFEKEWIYPVLFSFYEEDLRSYEIFQELLLIFFRKKYIRSTNLCSIDFNEEEFWSEMKSITNSLWRKRILPYSDEVFLKLERKNILEVLLSGLYPILINLNNRIFYVPLPIGLLNLEKNKLIKLIKWCDMQTEQIDYARGFSEIGDILTSFPAYLEFIKDLRQKILFTNYFKQMIIQMEAIKE